VQLTFRDKAAKLRRTHKQSEQLRAKLVAFTTESELSERWCLAESGPESSRRPKAQALSMHAVYCQWAAASSAKIGAEKGEQWLYVQMKAVISQQKQIWRRKWVHKLKTGFKEWLMEACLGSAAKAHALLREDIQVRLVTVALDNGEVSADPFDFLQDWQKSRPQYWRHPAREAAKRRAIEDAIKRATSNQHAKVTRRALDEAMRTLSNRKTRRGD